MAMVGWNPRPWTATVRRERQYSCRNAAHASGIPAIPRLLKLGTHRGTANTLASYAASGKERRFSRMGLALAKLFNSNRLSAQVSDLPYCSILAQPRAGCWFSLPRETCRSQIQRWGRRMSEANLDHSGTRAVPGFLTAAARRLLNWLAWLVLLTTAVIVWRAAAR